MQMHHTYVHRQKGNKIQRDNLITVSLMWSYFVNHSHSVKYIFFITAFFHWKVLLLLPNREEEELVALNGWQYPCPTI